MELRQLRYFLKATELLNFTEAAKQLYITQSTLSQQIKQLETELNVLLFDRIGKKVYLTEAGTEFLPFAKQTVFDADLGLQRIRDIQGINIGTLRIGITYSLSFGLAPIILKFMKEYPNIKLEVIYNTAMELLQMLKNRDLDFVLSFSMVVKEEQIEVTDLFDAPLCAIVHLRHPLAFQKNVSINDLKKYSLVLPSHGLSARSALDELLRDQEEKLDPHLEMNDANILLQLVETSLYMTVLSKTTIVGRKELKAIPILEQHNKMVASVLSLKDSYQKNSAKAFLDLYKKEHSVPNALR